MGDSGARDTAVKENKFIYNIYKINQKTKE